MQEIVVCLDLASSVMHAPSVLSACRYLLLSE
jgi:hypothetical protein